jgi:hypothetical protein
MQPTGFSTGAIAYGDFRTALDVLVASTADAIELSALRLGELRPLMDAVGSLDLRGYRHVSVHAPSHFPADAETLVVELLSRAAERNWPVVVHPDAMHEVERWSVLGRFLTIENMDKRKPVGRTVEELAPFFDRLPEAGMCFDIAHARQVDGSMTEAYRLLRRYGDRIRQVHVSEVTVDSRHARMSPTAEADYREVVALVPPEAAIIIESPLPVAAIGEELDRVRALFCTAVVS